MTDQLEEGGEIFVDVEFMCPFCGKPAGASVHPQAVLHEEPHCKEFDEMDALEYIVAARKAHTAHNQPGEPH